MKKDLHELPKVRDSLSYLYVEHAKIKQNRHSVKIIDKDGTTPVPCAALNLLMLGPGTSVTHAAIRNLIENDCFIIWCGEEGVRFYAQGLGRTRSAKNIIHQSCLNAVPIFRLLVAKKMYLMRFNESLSSELTIRQIRGKEGARIQTVYRQNSDRTGVPWKRRYYNRTSWSATDPVNRALSSANACLYGICHAAIVAMGYSPALGFIHTGKQLSFVYDIADLYKTELTIPLAFDIVKEDSKSISMRVRSECREVFRKSRLLKRIVKDIKKVLDINDFLNDMQKDFLKNSMIEKRDYGSDAALPGYLWDPKGYFNSGKSYKDDSK